jgi:hypothetical protein
MSGKVRYLVAWFNRSDWDEIKSLCPPDDLQDTYDQWLANVQSGLHAQGLTEDHIQKVVLTPDDLRDWKAANGGEINSKVRAALAIDLGHKRQETRH